MNNIRSRTEKSIIENLSNNNLSLQEIYSLSPADNNMTNLIMAKLINKYHLNVVPKSSTSSPILKISAAA
jgi:hypothetical protein